MGLFFLLLMMVLGLQVVTKKPLCIDSSIVYKIDRVGKSGLETVFTCRDAVQTPFSQYFFENLPQLESRLFVVEALIGHLIRPQKITITIDESNEMSVAQMRMRADNLIVSPAFLATEKFEMALLRMQIFRSPEKFTEEYMDFVVSVLFSHDKNKTENWVLQAWQDSFAQLSFFEKRRFAAIVFRQLLFHEHSKTELITSLSSALTEALKEDRALVSAFQKKFQKNLHDFGYIVLAGDDLRDLDFVVDVSEHQSWTKDLIALAKRYPEVKAAVRNREGLFLLPSYTRVPTSLESRIKANYRLLFDRQEPQPFLIKQNYTGTNKLILLKTGGIPFQFTVLFGAGPEEFLLKNKDIVFVQFHLPSLSLRMRELSQIQDYFKFVKSSDSQTSERRSLGWNESEVIEGSRIFKPVAIYDAIQFFRVN